MIAEFMHFYHYKIDDVFNMYAKTFYVLLASMYRIQGMYNAQRAYQTAVSFSGGDAYQKYIEQQSEQAEGLKRYIRQVRTIKGLKK